MQTNIKKKSCYKLHSKITPVKSLFRRAKKDLPSLSFSHSTHNFNQAWGVISMPHMHGGGEHTPKKYLWCTLICMNAWGLVTPLEPPSYLSAPRLSGITHSVSAAAEVLFLRSTGRNKKVDTFWTLWSTADIKTCAIVGKESSEV